MTWFQRFLGVFSTAVRYGKDQEAVSCQHLNAQLERPRGLGCFVERKKAAFSISGSKIATMLQIRFRRELLDHFTTAQFRMIIGRNLLWRDRNLRMQ